MKQNRVSGSASMTGGLVTGAIVCMAIIFVCAATGAAMISAGTVKENAEGYIAMITLFLASFVGTAVGAMRVKEKRIYICLMIAGVSFVILFAMTALFFDGQYEGVGVTLLVILSGGIAAAVLRKGKGSHKNLRKSKIKRR